MNLLPTLLIATFCAFVRAQTSTSCYPLNSTCPKDTALGTSFFQTWNASSPSALNTDYWTVTAGDDLIQMTDGGMQLSLQKKGDSVTIQTSFYIFWGEAEVLFQAAPGQGIISTFNFLSDDLDEIDVEVIGANETDVSTNWYGQGDQSQKNDAWFPVTPSPFAQIHSYKVIWDQHQIQWLFDNQTVRTMPAAAPKQYPQTPSFLKIGIWSAGDSSQPGVVTWSGGATDWSNDKSYHMLVKSVSIKDGSANASSYSYPPNSDGSWQSIDVVNGTSAPAKAVAQGPPETVQQRWHGLSTGAKIGIAVGVIGLVAIGALAFFVFFWKQRRAGKKLRKQEDALWDREHTELMGYKGGMEHDDNPFGTSNISVATAKATRPAW